MVLAAMMLLSEHGVEFARTDCLTLSAACLLLLCQVERHTGQQYFKRMSLRECLKVSVDRCAIFFRKVGSHCCPYNSCSSFCIIHSATGARRIYQHAHLLPCYLKDALHHGSLC
jgi:hypothetical protein